MELPLLTQIYIMSTAVGTVFMSVSVIFGARHHSHGGAGHGAQIHAGGHGPKIHMGGHHGVGGHGGIAHSGGGVPGGGHGGAAGHGLAGHGGVAGHGGAAGTGGVAGHAGAGAHGAVGQSGAAGHGAGIGHGASGHGGAAGHGGASMGADGGHVPAAAGPEMATTGPLITDPGAMTGSRPLSRLVSKIHGLHVELREENLLEAVLGFLNPLSIATFLAFFGVSGTALSMSFHLPEIFTFPIACVVGYIAVQVVTHTIAFLFEHMGVSTEAKVQELIGRMAEVSVPIDAGRVGEITYVVGSKRYTAPAKSTDPAVSLTKRSMVQICEIENNIMFVEPWKDSFVDPSFDSQRLV